MNQAEPGTSGSEGPGPQGNVGPPEVAMANTRALGIAIGACLVAVVLTVILAPGPGEGWYDTLLRPDPIVPEPVLALLALAYYPVMAILLYRAQVHVFDPARRFLVGALIASLLGQAAWNPVLLLVENLVAGVMATGLLAALMAAVLIALVPRDRTAAWLILPYAGLALHDLWWATALLQLNA